MIQENSSFIDEILVCQSPAGLPLAENVLGCIRLMHVFKRRLESEEVTLVFSPTEETLVVPDTFVDKVGLAAD